MTSSQPICLSSDEESDAIQVVQPPALSKADSFDDDDDIVKGPSQLAIQVRMDEIRALFPRRHRTARLPPTGNALIGLSHAQKHTERRNRIKANRVGPLESEAFRLTCRCYAGLKLPKVPGYEVLLQPPIPHDGTVVRGCLALIKGKWILCDVDYKNPIIPWAIFVEIQDLPFELLAGPVENLAHFLNMSVYSDCPIRCFKPKLSHVVQVFNPAMPPV